MKGRQPTPAVPVSQSQAGRQDMVKSGQGKRTILYVSISWLLCCCRGCCLSFSVTLCMPRAHRTPSVAPGTTISENVFCIHSYEYVTRCGNSLRIDKGSLFLKCRIGAELIFLYTPLPLKLILKRKLKCFFPADQKMSRRSKSGRNAIISGK